MAKPSYYALCKNGKTNCPDVALIQTWINGYDSPCVTIPTLKVDGNFGSKTEQAVRTFQMLSGLTSDGKVGKNTWNALYDAYSMTHGAGEHYPGVLMKQGQRGATVRSAQTCLERAGFSLTADGIYGAKTASAVKKYQSMFGLHADGIIGPATWSSLYGY